MDKKVARQVLDSLDRSANTIEQLKVANFISPESADELIRNIDSSADRIQVAAYGKDSFDAYRANVAKVIKSEPDEPYMKTFENPQKPIKVEPDEPYMKKAPKGFQPGTGGDTFDSDDTSQVSERDEYEVRDLSEWADKTQKQPSWPSGSKGKSTKIGANRRPSTEKSWAR